MNIERANLETILTDIATHYQHACDKHPFFAHYLLNVDRRLDMSECLKNIRQKLADQGHEQKVEAIVVLECEVTEAMEAYQNGNIPQTREELLDSIAVLIRMIDVLDGLQELGNLKRN